MKGLKMNKEAKIKGNCESCGNDYIVKVRTSKYKHGELIIKCPHCKEVTYNWDE